MINEERVILMTKMASYEKGPGKKNVAIGNYFRGDYIGFQVLKSIICATIAFTIIFCVYVFYHFETYMQEVYKMDLMDMGESILILYLVIAGAYGVMTYVIYAYRYGMAKKSLRVYYANLKKLSQMHNAK